MHRYRTISKALAVAAAAGALTAALAAAPAQAATTCNSGRVCFIGTSGDVLNLDPDIAFPKCSTGAAAPYSGIDTARNRSNRALNVYLSPGTPISRLDPGETIDFTPAATYHFCLWGL
jgi:hypothetical protein